ncbi:MAG: hypothetical protein PWR01_1920 [Clostridiales bacterium]|jgi:hypothetical protein|nr:hypothetical protein [Clostridiales bacterium]MDN5280847.1 hypothetical protein [Candidatus Ozemobacter sp.]
MNSSTQLKSNRNLKFLMIFIFFVVTALLQGCLSSTTNKTSLGTLTGEIMHLAQSELLIMGENSKTLVKTDENGKFAASLTPGRYQLLMQSSNGELVVIKRDIQIENNLTFIVTDVDLIPVPQVISVSVPLIYDTSAIIEWETNIESDGLIEYGTNELYGFASYSDTDLKTRHRIQLYDLLPDTTYHFRIAASRYNLDSARSYSRDYAFTTTP